MKDPKAPIVGTPPQLPEHMTAALNSAASTTGEYVSPLPEIPAHVEQSLTEGATLLRKVDAAVAGIAAQQFECAKVMGQIQAFEMIGNLTTTGRIELIRQMQESKAYKGMQVPRPDGGMFTITSFEQFCEFMGTSQSKVYEDIKNLHVFGEQFLNSAQNMGLGYRQLRQLRQLPEDERARLLAEGDPEDLKDALADALAEKAKAEKAAKEAVADKQAVEKVLSDKSKRLDSTTTELVKMKNLTPDEAVLAQGEKERTALQALFTAGLELMGCFVQYRAKAAAILQLQGVEAGTVETVTNLTSGMCRTIAEGLLSTGIDIDFRIITYPLSMGELALRGMEVPENPAEQVEK